MVKDNTKTNITWHPLPVIFIQFMAIPYKCLINFGLFQMLVMDWEAIFRMTILLEENREEIELLLRFNR